MKDLVIKMFECFEEQLNLNSDLLEIGDFIPEENIVTCICGKTAGVYNLEDDFFYF